jgi:two-component system, LytTR family, response regulator
LLKPVTFERFLKAIQKATAYFKKERTWHKSNDTDKQNFFIKSGKNFISVELKDIFFIQGLKDYVLFHTHNAKHIAYKRMKELEETLPPFFSRIHNSFIINTTHIEKIEDNHVFINNERIAISDKYKEDFLQIINSKLL